LNRAFDLDFFTFPFLCCAAATFEGRSSIDHLTTENQNRFSEVGSSNAAYEEEYRKWRFQRRIGGSIKNHERVATTT
jgi:hypothetical protein